jgi:hypothetical protein
MSVAGMPHVSHHNKDVVYGKQKVFATFDLSKVERLPTQRYQKKMQCEALLIL